MKPSPPKRRALTALEKLMRKKYTRLFVWPKPTGYSVFLTVDVQSFSTGCPIKSKAKAEWHRDMLAIAISKIEL